MNVHTHKVIVEELRILTLQDNMDETTLPEGGWINKDSHLLVFVPEYFEDEIADPDEPEYEDFFDDIEEVYANDIDDVF